VVICGNEKLNYKQKVVTISKEYNGPGYVDTYHITEDTYSKYFQLEVDPATGSSKCGVKEYKLVKEVDGKFEDYNDDSVISLDGDMMLKLKNRLTDVRLFLQATTRGGIVQR